MNKDQERGPVPQKNAWSVLDEGGGGGGGGGQSSSSRTLSQKDSFSSPPVLAVVDPLKKRMENHGGNHGYKQQQFVSSSSSSSFVGGGSGGTMSGAMSGFVFKAPLWSYEDPSRKVQGPFTSEQMHGWFKEGKKIIRFSLDTQEHDSF